ncbi:MAG: XRE family transcriptional regulator [Actinobacteria bacterium HGW-Actinobacteria-9]|jgi:transcriptional regulator with XRE-family HTH domain|nr:MAG: XRE family transcriptional regulator [Actinobacteria bacterium HGW-Actinobacteria-9]
MSTDFKEIGLRIQGLRESCDITREDMAKEMGIPVETYAAYEDTGADVPISALFHIANKFGVDMTAILTGIGGKLDTYQVVKAGHGSTVDRYAGYHYQDLAGGFSHKIMQPLLVTLDPSDEPAELVTHSGQEFNLVLQGSVTVTFDDKELTLNAGDSIYFNPTHPHGQKCGSRTPAQFVTIIVE